MAMRTRYSWVYIAGLGLVPFYRAPDGGADARDENEQLSAP